MNIARKIALSLLLVLTGSLCAFAQEPAGKFTLTHEVRWEGALVSAGTYTAAVHTGPVPYVLVTSEKPGALSIMAVAQYVETAQCKSSSLELEQGEKGWSVRSLCLESSVGVYFGARQAKLAQSRPAATPEVASIGGAR
jgi:hypothetical protein